MSRGTGRIRAHARASVGALSAVAAVTLGAVALVHPLQYLGFHTRGAPRTAVPVLAAVAFALVVAGAPTLASAGADARRARAPGWLLPVLAAGVAWPVFAVAFVPAALVFDAPARPLAVLAALALAGALVVRPAWRAKSAVGALLAAGAAALIAVNLGLAGAVALLVLLALLGAVAARSGADGDRGVGRRSAARESDRDAPEPADRGRPIRAVGGAPELSLGPVDLVGPALLVAAAGFWAPAPSLGVPLLPLNFPAVAGILGAAVGALARVGLSRRGLAPGPVLPSGGALAGYLAGALWTGVSLSGALGG